MSLKRSFGRGSNRNWRQPLIAIAGSALFLTGCISSGPQSGIRPAPLQPAPVAPVTSTALEPVNTTQTDPFATDANAASEDLQAIPTANAGTGVGATDLRISPDAPFGNNDVLGAWNAEAQGSACALSLSLTQWTGGFRASTRRCENPDLKSIGAWQLSGKQLVLFDQSGSVKARLYASGVNRFDGQFSGTSTPISVYR